MTLRMTLELKRGIEDPDAMVAMGQETMQALQDLGWYVFPKADFELHGHIDRDAPASVGGDS